MAIYIYGAGGHGRVVYDAAQQSRMNCSGFIDDADIKSCAGLPVLTSKALNANDVVHIAIGDCKIRSKIANAIFDSVSFINVIHPLACISKSCIYGQGNFFAAYSILAPDACIGNHSIFNHGAVVDHDTVIGDFVHVAPNAVIGGAVKVGYNVLVGSGSVILPGLTIGNNVIIGAGAVVTKDIVDNAIVIGNPAKIVKFNS